MIQGSCRVNKPVEAERRRLVWEEVVEAFANQRPIKGRILNSIKGGYSVGVAGHAGFLPERVCSILTASKVGVLQDFLISNVDEKHNQFTLVDYAIYKQKLEKDEKFKECLQQRAEM